MSYLSLQGPVPRPRPRPNPASGAGPSSGINLDLGKRGRARDRGRSCTDGPRGSDKSETQAVPGGSGVPKGRPATLGRGASDASGSKEPAPETSGLCRKPKATCQIPLDSDLSDGDIYEDVEVRAPCSHPGTSERRGRAATLSSRGGVAAENEHEDEDEDNVQGWYRGTNSVFNHWMRAFRNTACLYCPSRRAVRNWVRRRARYIVSLVVLLIILLICWLLAKYTSTHPINLPNIHVTHGNHHHGGDHHNGGHGSEHGDHHRDGHHHDGGDGGDGRVHHGPHEHGDPNTQEGTSYDEEYDYYGEYGHFDHDHHGARHSNRSGCDYDVGTVHHGYPSVGRYASSLCEVISYNITRPNGSCSSVCVIHCFHLTAREYIDIYLRNLAQEVGCQNNIDGNFTNSENLLVAMTFWFNSTNIRDVNLTFRGDSGNASFYVHPQDGDDHQELIVLYKNETGNNTHAVAHINTNNNASNVLMFSCNSTESIAHYVCGTGGMTGMTGIHHTRQTWTHVNVTGLLCNNTIEGTKHVTGHQSCRTGSLLNL
ncbi:ORF011 [Saltwater crocodilepox virus]|nr:ORF011 [Saltwater crocodilepox virus]